MAVFAALGSPAQIAITGLGIFAVNLLPWMILSFLILSQTGRRTAFRNNLQLVADATRELSKLSSAIVILADSAYQNRLALVKSRDLRVVEALKKASNGRIRWTDGFKLELLERSPRSSSNRIDPVCAASDRKETDALAESLVNAIKTIDGIVESIHKNGLGIICARICTPATIGFLPILGGYGDWKFRPRSTAPTNRLLAITDAQNEVSKIMEELEAYIACTLETGPDDDALEIIERILSASCRDMDRQILQHHLAENELWAMGQFLHRHILGGPIDQLKK